jgi:hypothetical protein
MLRLQYSDKLSEVALDLSCSVIPFATGWLQSKADQKGESTWSEVCVSALNSYSFIFVQVWLNMRGNLDKEHFWPYVSTLLSAAAMNALGYYMHRTFGAHAEDLLERLNRYLFQTPSKK